MVARRRKTDDATSRPYPFDRDFTLAGTLVRIKGERGTYKIIAHEFNPRNGKHWFSMFGGPYQHFRNKHPKDITPVKRGTSLDY